MGENRNKERVLSMEKKKKHKSKRTLSSMQEVTYQHEFKMADLAAGRQDRKSKH